MLVLLVLVLVPLVFSDDAYGACCDRGPPPSDAACASSMVVSFGSISVRLSRPPLRRFSSSGRMRFFATLPLTWYETVAPFSMATEDGER